MTQIKKMVSVEIISNTPKIIEFDPMKKIAVHRINIDGSEELDVWLKSIIYEDKMVSSVVEYIKTPRGDWQQVDIKNTSERYNNLSMILDNNSYINTTNSDLLTGDDIYEDDISKEILDDNGGLNIDNPVSYEPKKFEQKIKENLTPAFMFFEKSNNFKTMLYNSMVNR